MFGFGFSEVVTICIVVVVLVNPKDLPLIMRKLGKLYGSLMKQINGARKTYREFEKELEYASDIDLGGKANTQGKNIKIIKDERSLS
jgi:Sec-independent protein translocase protein TatA